MGFVCRGWENTSDVEGLASERGPGWDKSRADQISQQQTGGEPSLPSHLRAHMDSSPTGLQPASAQHWAAPADTWTQCSRDKTPLTVNAQVSLGSSLLMKLKSRNERGSDARLARQCPRRWFNSTTIASWRVLFHSQMKTLTGYCCSLSRMDPAVNDAKPALHWKASHKGILIDFPRSLFPFTGLWCCTFI